MDDALLPDSGICGGKKTLSFQAPAFWFCKFFQIYFWAKRGKSMRCGRKNLESPFFGFGGLVCGYGSPAWRLSKNEHSMIPYFQKEFVAVQMGDYFWRRFPPCGGRWPAEPAR
ncbi:MAG: hypothetical protein ABSE69_17175 [Roseiarcus sp.]